MHATHHVVYDWAHRDRLVHRVDAHIPVCQFSHEGDFGIDLFFTQVPDIEVHVIAVRPRKGAAFVHLVHKRLGEFVAGTKLHGTQARPGFGRAQSIVLQVPIAVLVQ